MLPKNTISSHYYLKKQCHTVFITTKHAQQWTIRKMSQLIESQHIVILTERFFGQGSGNTSFNVQVFMSGDGSVGSDYISAHVRILGVQGLSARTVLGLRNSHNKSIAVLSKDFRVIDTKDVIVFPKFIRKSWLVLKGESYLNKGEIHIVLKVRFWTSELKSGPAVPKPDEYKKLRYHFDNQIALLNGSRPGDLYLRSGDFTMAVHKKILAERSSVLAVLTEPLENNQILEVSGLNGWTLDQLVRFIYTWELPELDIRKAKILLKQSSRFRLKELGYGCFQYLCDNLSKSNVVEIMLYAQQNSLADLLQACICYVVQPDTCLEDIGNYDIIRDNHPDLMVMMIDQTVANRFDAKVVTGGTLIE